METVAVDGGVERVAVAAQRMCPPSAAPGRLPSPPARTGGTDGGSWGLRLVACTLFPFFPLRANAPPCLRRGPPPPPPWPPRQGNAPGAAHPPSREGIGAPWHGGGGGAVPDVPTASHAALVEAEERKGGQGGWGRAGRTSAAQPPVKKGSTSGVAGWGRPPAAACPCAALEPNRKESWRCRPLPQRGLAAAATSGTAAGSGSSPPPSVSSAPARQPASAIPVSVSRPPTHRRDRRTPRRAASRRGAATARSPSPRPPSPARRPPRPDRLPAPREPHPPGRPPAGQSVRPGALLLTHTSPSPSLPAARPPAHLSASEHMGHAAPRNPLLPPPPPLPTPLPPALLIPPYPSLPPHSASWQLVG